MNDVSNLYRSSLLTLSAAVSLSVLTTCISTTNTPAITVSAAASLQSPLKAIKAAYEETSETTITYTFGSSGSLTQQIAQGAPVDLILSASDYWINELSEQNLTETNTHTCLLTNSLVLIVPQSSTATTQFKDIHSDPFIKIAVGEPNSVPVGQYTQEAFTFFNLPDSLNAQLVYGRDARQVLTYVETENAAAGVVYVTDAQASNQVRIVDTAPARSHSPINYLAAIIKDSKHPETTQNFLNFLSSQTAQTIFERHGFIPTQTCL